jgi:hypothetical protein
MISGRSKGEPGGDHALPNARVHPFPSQIPRGQPRPRGKDPAPAAKVPKTAEGREGGGQRTQAEGGIMSIWLW